jgi:Tol biopolymer transport system component
MSRRICEAECAARDWRGYSCWNFMERPPQTQASSRLDSWKEIATHLRRDVRTVQRWEKEEGLPVHRLLHGKQGTVYAHAAEIDAWWESRRRALDTAGSHSRPTAKLAIAVTLGVALAVVSWVVSRFSVPTFRQSEPPLLAPAVFEFSVPVSEGAGFSLAVAGDGRRIAFDTCCSAPQIWLHTFESALTMPLAGTEGGFDPFWSPDGLRLAFFADGKLKVIDTRGGPPTTLCDASHPNRLLNPAGSWSTHDVIMFASGSDLYHVPATGGTPVRVAVDDLVGESAIRKAPRILADGRHFIYHATGRDGGAVYLGSLDSPKTKRLVDSEYPALVSSSDEVLFVRGTALMAQHFNPATFVNEGEARLVAPDVAPGTLNSPARFSISRNGVLAFIKTRGGRLGQLTWFDRSGRAVSAITQPAGGEYLNPAISPDGTQVAVNRMDPQTGNWDVWIIDLARNVPSRVTFDRAQDSDPVWSPDSREIIFASNREGRAALYRKTVAGTKSEELLVSVGSTVALIPSDWSADGRMLVYSMWARAAGGQIWALPLVGDRKPILVVNADLSASGGRLSPDGKWIAYTSSQTGKFQVYVQRFLESGERQQISQSGGAHPRWSADGRTLVYWVPSGGLASVDVRVKGEQFSAGVPKDVITANIPTLADGRTHWDMTRGGRRFLVRQPLTSQPPAITVLLNWPAKVALK